QIDQYFHLKDRILTAIQIYNNDKITPMMQIQIEDAANHISRVDLSAVVRYRFLFGVVLVLFFVLAGYCCGVILVTNSEHATNFAKIKLPQNSISDSNQSRNIVQKIVDDIRNNDHANLSVHEQDEMSDELRLINKRLHGEVAQGIQRLTKTSTSLDSAAVLSEIEQSIKQAITEIDIQSYNFSFQAMATAFDNSGILRDTATAIKNHDYNKAAATIKSVTNENFSNMSQLERRSLNAGLGDAADEMRIREQDELEHLTRKFADEIVYDQKDYKPTVDQIAQQYKQQFVRNKLHADLTQQLAKIDQHKSDLLTMYNQELGQSASGLFFAEQNNGFNNSANQTSNVGNNSDNSIGGDPRGGDVGQRDNLLDISVTKINIAREGMNGNGEHELVEVIPDADLTRANNLTYKNLYLQHRKKAEAVLEVESIPLGRRQMIRRYFDSIIP
ncbi:MAG: hypothetical protein LBH59_08250, partial [Planctomycetaceae bacterium]|nr:hypothetical protein [Planctomycetaceae bacterium]